MTALSKAIEAILSVKQIKLKPSLLKNIYSVISFPVRKEI